MVMVVVREHVRMWVHVCVRGEVKMCACMHMHVALKGQGGMHAGKGDAAEQDFCL